MKRWAEVAGRPGTRDSIDALEGRLIDLIYASLVDEQAWADFLKEISGCCPGGGSTLFFHDGHAASGGISMTHGIPPDFEKAYPSYAPKNLWMRNINRRPIGLGVRAEAMCPFSEVERSEYYNELLKPHGIHSGIGITLQRDGTRSFMLSVIGAAQEERVEQGAADMLTRLAPHLSRIFALHRRALSQAPTLALAGALDAIRVGVIKVGPGKAVLWANDEAERLLEQGRGVGRDLAGRLRILDEALDRALGEMLSRTPPSDAASRTVAGEIHRPAATAPLKVTLANSGQSLIERYFAGPTALVLLEGRPATAAMEPAAIMRRFGFTRREAEIACDIGAGLTLAAVAGRRGIATETVRVHVKRLFAKTGTHRQAELIARLLDSHGHDPA